MEDRPVEIRDATEEDAAGLLPLLTALGYPANAATLRARMSALRQQDPGGRVLVAEAGRRIIGLMTLHITPALHRPTPVGRITILVTLPDHRAAGVGRRLVEAAEEHFRRLGLTRVEVTSGPTHKGAYGFYRKLGYEDQGVRFARSLASDASGGA